MPNLLTLPRELRDLIYDSLLLPSPLPSPPTTKFLSYDPSSPYQKIYEPHAHLRGDFGCAFARTSNTITTTTTTTVATTANTTSPSTATSAVASFLCTSRQVHAELSDALRRAERRGHLCVRLDCMAVDESWFYFGVRAGQGVRTGWEVVKVAKKDDQESKRRGANGRGANSKGIKEEEKGWVEGLVEWWMGEKDQMGEKVTTRIARLVVDVRIMGGRKGKVGGRAGARTGWAVCAAVKRVCDRGVEWENEREQCDGRIVEVEVDELVLNVVTPVAEEGAPPVKFLEEDFPLDGMEDGVVHPRTVARELDEVWSRIWAGEEPVGGVYRGLLERIGWVRVCVDGETFKVRELRGILERGRVERGWIRLRIGM